MTPRLAVENLSVEFSTDEGPVLAVDRMSFTVEPREVLALVGESGCGKSVTSMSILGLLPRSATVSGSIEFEGRELTSLPEAAIREIRGRDVSMIFQEPMTSLNPSFTVGFQIREVLHRHERMTRRQSWARASELLELVRMPAPEARLREYPHQLSGGMRQRVMIAMAVACNPKVLIADEPTTALDVTIQAQILDILRDLREEVGTSILLITHDLGVVADIADRVAIMYAGHQVESGPVDDLFAHPQHPYTAGLLGAVPRPDRFNRSGSRRLQEIPGLVPVLHGRPDACVFAPRCARASGECATSMPVLEQTRPAQYAACFHAGESLAVAGEKGHHS
ncbi:MAG: peptide/nickel transport system ATP-binding protein [Pseudonocardiales bacterium]|nr:peptide/nickel transport system ATP-binding protein [Pseudonocardiales bacterium]